MYFWHWFMLRATTERSFLEFRVSLGMWRRVGRVVSDVPNDHDVFISGACQTAWPWKWSDYDLSKRKELLARAAGRLISQKSLNLQQRCSLPRGVKMCLILWTTKYWGRYMGQYKRGIPGKLDTVGHGLTNLISSRRLVVSQNHFFHKK
jgi:hypothetical protein